MRLMRLYQTLTVFALIHYAPRQCACRSRNSDTEWRGEKQNATSIPYRGVGRHNLGMPHGRAGQKLDVTICNNVPFPYGHGNILILRFYNLQQGH